MTQAGGHEKRKAVRSKFARKSTTTVQKVDRGIAPKGPFFQKTRRKHQKWCDQRGNFRPKTGPTRKLCDRCRHRPNRRVKCRICKRAVGPCCLATDEPNPLCRDCWEPDPEQTKTQRDEVFQPEDSTGSTETFDPWNKNKDETLTKTKSHQSRGSRFLRSRSRRRRNFRTQKEMESRERKFDHKKMESKDMSSDEEERRKEFVCWMMEPARRQKKRRTSSMTIGTKSMNSKEEQTAMETSESKRDIPRRETSKRSRAPSPERWREELESGEKRRKLGDYRTVH